MIWGKLRLACRLPLHYRIPFLSTRGDQCLYFLFFQSAEAFWTAYCQFLQPFTGVKEGLPFS